MWHPKLIILVIILVCLLFALALLACHLWVLETWIESRLLLDSKKHRVNIPQTTTEKPPSGCRIVNLRVARASSPNVANAIIRSEFDIQDAANVGRRSWLVRLKDWDTSRGLWRWRQATPRRSSKCVHRLLGRNGVTVAMHCIHGSRCQLSDVVHRTATKVAIRTGIGDKVP
ncbi:hypothetical protein B0T16DRAFT_396543 [Cercophora newfieldiana]|uniref:Uncharacterized protein n=1 Tax=Cercophora newfieldiana TaxID=92897 RepID=A0AA39YNS5_9PEZI|nr:hypothetical protein B0T16DRAFT_396543 [Cercophora newfieldiana]